MRWSLLAGLIVGGAIGAAIALSILDSDPDPEPAEPTPWEIAAKAVARSDRYAGWPGKSLAPQEDLVPLGEDPLSGLQEFAIRGTGSIPFRGADLRLELPEDAAVILVLLPGGPYRRGAQTNPAYPNFDEWATEFEGPVTEVTLRPFFIAKYETTMSQWEALAEEETGEFGPRLPRTGLSHGRAREVLAARGLRLPSEAEWEYACRAGSGTRYWNGEVDLAEAGWTIENSGREGNFMGADEGAVHAVGELDANAFGLHDVHGNVAEWCEDRWHPSYEGAPTDGSAWTDGATRGRVVRGGSWRHEASEARSAARRAESPDRERPWLGVRIARSLE